MLSLTLNKVKLDSNYTDKYWKFNVVIFDIFMHLFDYVCHPLRYFKIKYHNDLRFDYIYIYIYKNNGTLHRLLRS